MQQSTYTYEIVILLLALESPRPPSCTYIYKLHMKCKFKNNFLQETTPVPATPRALAQPKVSNGQEHTSFPIAKGYTCIGKRIYVCISQYTQCSGRSKNIAERLMKR